MDSRTIFGGNPFGVIVRLLLLSIAVGVVLSVLGITPENFFERLSDIMRRLYDLGFGAFESIFGYLLLGAMVVVPIWLIIRLASARRNSRPPEV